MSEDQPRSRALRPEHAFVVQFGADTDSDIDHVVGRVEHLVSRQAIKFQSLGALLAFVTRLLREVQAGSSQADV